jgi:hypothetical protein
MTERWDRGFLNGAPMQEKSWFLKRQPKLASQKLFHRPFPFSNDPKTVSIQITVRDKLRVLLRRKQLWIMTKGLLGNF